MPTRTPRIFVADDQRDVVESLRLLLKGEGYAAETFEHPEALIAALRERTADAVLMDLNYTRDTTSGDEGLDTSRVSARSTPTRRSSLMTAWGSDRARRRRHAPRRAGLHREAVGQRAAADGAAHASRARPGVAAARARSRPRTASSRPSDGELIAESPAMQPVLETIERVAPTDANVLITGESGCGKGLVARLIHDGSPRRERSLVTVNIGSLAGDGVRERDVRPREGRVHGREERSRRPLRARRRRHAVPRRDREHSGRAAGAAAARARGRRVRAARLVAHAARRRARARGDERRHRRQRSTRAAFAATCSIG